MPASNKTGLVLKISVVLFVLLALVVYKLNDYFKNEKQYSSEAQLRNKVVQVKTSVSSQLSQLKNVLSGYDNELVEVNINWVQLDPFFAIARIDDTGRMLKVSQLLVRSNTPAERWNENYLERALMLNKANGKNPILAQLFQDKAGSKFLILRFKTAQKKEVALVGNADYFQKFFDNERGESSTALLVTTENMLAAHSEGNYIATWTQEPKFSKKKYLMEREEILGTNLIAINYILKKKIATGLVLPWSIIGVVVGFGCILVAVVFYSLDPIERKVERYKKQEREQIYKDTVGSMVSEAAAAKPEMVAPPKPINFSKLRENSNMPQKDLSAKPLHQTEAEMVTPPFVIAADEEVTKTVFIEPSVKPTTLMEEIEKSHSNVIIDHFKALEEPQIDMADIEKALSLDDLTADDSAGYAVSEQLMKDNLTSQKISVSRTGAPIDKPTFVLNKKDFLVNEFKVSIRRPENS